jgi:Ca2+-binding EF-hand superfamily protein
MGSKPSCPLSVEEKESLKQETGCTEAHLVDLWVRFEKLDRNGTGSLGREDFLAIPEFIMNPLADRITHLFFQVDAMIRQTLNG